MGKIIDRVRRREVRVDHQRDLIAYNGRMALWRAHWAAQERRYQDALDGPPMVRCFIGAAGEEPREITGATMGDLVANAQAATGSPR